MTLPHHHEHLEAMGIDIWIPRLDDSSPVGQEADQRFLIGPGDGSMLLLCAYSSEAATPLAADIARSLDCEPVWGWPMDEGDTAGLPLDQAIEERLITRVLVLGSELVNLDANAGSQVISGAKLAISESISAMLSNAGARKALWSVLCANNWCAAAKQPA
jgi:DNA polymerase III psi subunit